MAIISQTLVTLLEMLSEHSQNVSRNIFIFGDCIMINFATPNARLLIFGALSMTIIRARDSFSAGSSTGEIYKMVFEIVELRRFCRND